MGVVGLSVGGDWVLRGVDGERVGSGDGSPPYCLLQFTDYTRDFVSFFLFTDFICGTTLRISLLLSF